jgi:hypothetical protein
MIKIGRTHDIDERVRSLSAAHPFTLEVCYQYSGFGFLEGLVHYRLRDHLVSGGGSKEWFSVPAEEADSLIREEIGLSSSSQD